MAGATEHITPLVLEAAESAHVVGETVSFERLQEECGVGRGDLTEAITELVGRGELVEESPGEWRRPFEDEEREQRQATPKPDEPDERDERVRRTLDGRPRPRAGEAVLEGSRALAVGAGTVTFTAAMAEALSAEVLGQLMHAGIAEAKGAGREFVFVVTS